MVVGGAATLYTVMKFVPFLSVAASPLMMFMPGVNQRKVHDISADIAMGDETTQKKNKKTASGDRSRTPIWNGVGTGPDPRGFIGYSPAASASPWSVPGAPGHSRVERLHFLGVRAKPGGAPANPGKAQGYRACWAGGTAYANSPTTTDLLLDIGAPITPGGPRTDGRSYQLTDGTTVMPDGTHVRPRLQLPTPKCALLTPASPVLRSPVSPNYVSPSSFTVREPVEDVFTYVDLDAMLAACTISENQRQTTSAVERMHMPNRRSVVAPQIGVPSLRSALSPTLCSPTTRTPV